MKRCPKCNQTYQDDTQKFCTVDGGLLVTADKPFDPNATIAGSANLALPVAPPPESPVSNRPQDFSATIATPSTAPTAVLPKKTGPTGSVTSSNLPPPPPTTPPASAPTVALNASMPPTASVRPSAPAPPLPQTSGSLPPVVVAPLTKKSKLPLILGGVALLLILGVSAVGAAAYYFLVYKPKQEALQSERPPVVVENRNENANSTVNTNTEPPKAEEKTEEFVAPPDTAKFTNSEANLDGKLAEHYFDFSFYYPQDWVPDPKAGTAGSGNFAKVERRLPPDFTQENFAVRWYESKGTYTADLPNYPAQVEEFSASLAKAFPEYNKVSEGPTRINSLDAYEFRWTGVSRGTVKGDLQLWGRVVFVPTGVEGDKAGAVLTMFTTSLAPELSGVADVGQKGQSPVILDTFRFGKK
jgi:hypothetical protein